MSDYFYSLETLVLMSIPDKTFLTLTEFLMSFVEKENNQ